MRILLIVLMALAGSAAAHAACPDLPGAEALFASSKPRIVWVGEMHGTAEEPALFGDLVCIAGRTGRKVVVTLERTEAEQADWDAFLAGGDRARLTAGQSWHWSMQDGRSSEAMVALAERLRAFKTEGWLAAVRMMQREGGARSIANYKLDNETSMAEAVQSAARDYPDALILAYSGGLHARKTMSPIDKDLPLAASQLPRGEVASVDVEGLSGTAWTCLADGCGVHSFGERDHHARGVVMGAPEEGFDAAAYTGLPYTASPPAVTPRDK